MLEAGSGHIVNITTAVAEQPLARVPRRSPRMTKGGLNAVDRSLGDRVRRPGHSRERGLARRHQDADASPRRLTNSSPACTRSAGWARSRKSSTRSCILSRAARHRRDPARRWRCAGGALVRAARCGLTDASPTSSRSSTRLCLRRWRASPPPGSRLPSVPPGAWVRSVAPMSPSSPPMRLRNCAR